MRAHYFKHYVITLLRSRVTQAEVVSNSILFSPPTSKWSDIVVLPYLRVTFPTLLRNTWSCGCAELAQDEHLWLNVYTDCYNFFFFYDYSFRWIRPLFHGWNGVEPFEAALKNAIMTFNRFVHVEAHNMEKHPGMFSSKTLIYWKTWTSWTAWGWVNHPDIFILEVN